MESASFDIFISYARHDGMPLAEKIVASLRQTKLSVFWDKDSIPPGTNWEDALDNALEQAHHIIVILTPFSVKSEEVTAEWRPMLNKGKNIIPVMYLPCEVPRRLSMRQYIDFQDEAKYLVSFSALMTAINDISGSGQLEIELTGEDLLRRGTAYFESGQSDQSIKDYMLALRDKDTAIRKRAAILVGKTRLPENLLGIIKYLQKETDPEVKVELLAAIRKFIETSDWQPVVDNLPTVIEPFISDTVPEVRRAALRVLAYSQLPEVVPILSNFLLSDPAEEVRYQVALGLGRFNILESTRALMKGLLDSSPEVRRASARALGVHGSAEAIPALKLLANADKDREVRLAAAEAIDNIKRGKW